VALTVGTGTVTFKVTGTVTGLLVALAAVMVTLPVYVPAARPVGFTETLTLPAVVPLEGVAESQDAELEME
jgi:hypothetical protein